MEVIAEEKKHKTTNTLPLPSTEEFVPREQSKMHKFGDYPNLRSNPEVVGLFFEIASAPFDGSKKRG